MKFSLIDDNIIENFPFHNICTLFNFFCIFIGVAYFIVWLYQSLFIDSHAIGHLYCFHYFTISR